MMDNRTRAKQILDGGGRLPPGERIRAGSVPAARNCTAYLRFAQEEPGLFRTAFAIPDETRGAPVPAKAGNSGLNPFQLLGAALDRLVEAGMLPPGVAQVRNTWLGSRCAGWPCSSWTDRSADSFPRKGMPSGNAWLGFT